MKKKVCLECQKIEAECLCSDGFKVIYFLGRAVTEKEMRETPTFEEAKKTARREIKNISKLYDELFQKSERVSKKKTRRDQS